MLPGGGFHRAASSLFQKGWPPVSSNVQGSTRLSFANMGDVGYG
jgi:hypothetical protein